jgi:hypothetical protein
MPYDDTAPTNTEGTEFITVTITPTNAGSILEVVGCLFLGEDTNNDYIGCLGLFQDSISAALFAQPVGTTYVVSAPTPTGSSNNFTFRMTAGTTSPITFKVRAGWNTTSAMRINGSNGGRIFGGVSTSLLKVRELRV